MKTKPMRMAANVAFELMVGLVLAIGLLLILMQPEVQYNPSF